MPDNLNKRKNMSLKQKRKVLISFLEAINAAVITLIFIGGAVYLTAFPRETISHEETEKLTKFPKFSLSSYFDGSYTEGIADYYDDTVPNRSSIKKFISSKLLPLKGRQYGNDSITIYGSGFENQDKPEIKPADKPTTQPAVTTVPEASQNTKSSTSSTSYVSTTTVTTLPDNHNEAADGELTNNIVIVNNRGLMLYGGNYSAGEEYASYVNAYKETLGDSVNVYSMVCPTAVSFYMPENYLDLTGSEIDNIDHINEYLDGVTPVDAYTNLLLHKNENIYSRTDHHWQPLGAYYAAQAFAETAGVPFADLDQYETVTLPGYVGTLYGYTQSADLLNNPEDFVYYIPKTATETIRYDTYFSDPCPDSLLWDPSNMSNNSYYMVFGGDDRITHVSTSCHNGRNLVIFKDSYGNALLPVLTSSFENIYLCDVRYFDINAAWFIREVGATDLLFAMNTYSATGGNRSGIQANLYK